MSSTVEGKPLKKSITASVSSRYRTMVIHDGGTCVRWDRGQSCATHAPRPKRGRAFPILDELRRRGTLLLMRAHVRDTPDRSSLRPLGQRMRCACAALRDGQLFP